MTPKSQIATVAEFIPPVAGLPRNDILENLVSKLHQAVLELPVLLASAHSIRFSYPDESVKRLEEAMLKCNLCVVYLEQYRDLGKHEIEVEFFTEQIKNLLTCRMKTMHLQMSWKKFFAEKKTGDLKK